MALDADLLEPLTRGTVADAWGRIVAKALEIGSRPLSPANAPGAVAKRDREIGALDHLLSGCAWDLWDAFADPSRGGVECTADRLAHWWDAQTGAKAVLILDGLSLRELPWLLHGAQARGFCLHQATATAAELPAQTDAFARALGFASRAQLQNDGAGASHRLQPARTESVGMPWKDCAALIDGTPNWVFWHHWPDSKIHDGSGAGQGLDTLTRDAADQLGSDDFWDFLARLATGRRLIVASDHGYAATGYFPDADGEVGQFLKKTFASARAAPGAPDPGPFVPPVALPIDGPHGPHLLALGRRKWKSQGGYPTLTHGGLSLLEVLTPFVELSKTGG